MGLTQITTGGVDDNINIDSNTLKVDGTNNRVGVGTNDVNAPLEVRNSSALQIRTSTGTGNYWEFGRDNSTGDFFLADDGLGTVVAVDQITGNFGIGTSSPLAKLQVNGTTPIIRIEDENSGNKRLELSIDANAVAKISANQSASVLAFETTNSERLRIDSSGNVGIGVTAPSAKLNVRRGDADGKIAEFHQSAGYGIAIESSQSVATIKAEYNQALTFKTGTTATERMRLDSSGRLLVGLTSSTGSHALEVNGGADNEPIKVESSDAGAYVRFEDNDTTGSTRLGAVDNDFKIDVNSAERLRISSNGNVGINTTSSSNKLRIHEGSDTPNVVIVTGADESSEFLALGINSGVPCVTAGGVSSTDASLAFRTADNGTESERGRFTHNGYFLVGTSHTSPGDANTNAGFSVQPNGKIYVSCAADGGHINRNNDGYILHARRSGSFVGGISVSSTNTAFNTSSDYRLKENVVDIADGITRVKQLAPKRFNFIVDADTTVDGFLAHEAQTVVPEAVVGTHNEVDDNGDPVYQGIDLSKLIPLLTAALKEAIAKIETLETKVAALEAAE